MTPEERRVIVASSLGTVFEWYDFYLYGSLAGIIAQQIENHLIPAAIRLFELARGRERKKGRGGGRMHGRRGVQRRRKWLPMKRRMLLIPQPLMLRLGRDRWMWR